MLLRSYCLAALTVLSLAPGARAQANPSTENVKSELRLLMSELNQALATKDRAALERIYADDFLFVHALGAAIDKKGQIDAALTSRGGSGVPVPALEGLLVFGDVAIYRRPEPERFGTTIYVKRAGRWQIFQLQGTPLPSTRTNAAVPADVLRGYAGRYEQDNGLFVTIAVEGSALTLQVDGRQKFTLTTDSETKFSLPAGGGQFTFKKNDAGTMTYELIRGNGTVVKGTRVQ